MLVVYDPFASWDLDRLVWSIRAFYIFASYAILIVRFIPDLNSRFLDYGPRTAGTEKKAVDNSVLPRWFRIQFDPVLDWLAEMTVPHAWFTHFYICSSICSAFWLYQSQISWRDFPSLTRHHISSQQGRVAYCMMLLQLQGLRRLYECLFVAKASKSRMWIGHYFIGLAFYLATNIAVWIELAYDSSQVFDNTDFVIIDLANLYRLVACTLKEYRVPDHPIFRATNLVCPHYYFEVNIYLAFALLTAQAGRILNMTMFCATAFVIVNLGVTADLTKKWQMLKFPKQRPEIAGRRRMLGSIW